MRRLFEQLKSHAAECKLTLPAVYLAIKKKETPFFAKALAILTLVLALSPIDLIPDFIPVLGLLDDVILLPLLMAAAISLIPAETMEACKAEAEGLWTDNKPGKWYYALPIVIFWGLVLWSITVGVLRLFHPR
ncbi:MAG: DUF1232 domain-containing protein [Clostridia bacterium]|nr:DUF1232 domain-containing protein [Clostridia bacterium]